MLKIMIIDDDRQFCMLMKKMLELAGYHVMTHHSLITAKEHLEQELPDLLCCDLNMAGDSGLEFLAHRRKILGMSGVPVIAITGDYLKSSQVKAAELGVSAYLVKPFAKSELLSAIESALETNRQNPNSFEISL